MPLHLWQAETGTVCLQGARLSGVVDPRNPALGMHQLRLDSTPLAEANLLGVELPAAQVPAPAAPAATSNVDFYVRGNDLVATYAETEQWPLRAQIYWRVVAESRENSLCAVELIASVQTSLLDSRPELMTRSELHASEAFQLLDSQRPDFEPIGADAAASDQNEHLERPPCYLFRLPSAKFSYAEMVHPADAQRSSCRLRARGGELEILLRHQLFAERLEKGVILRARVLGVWLDREGDQAAAVRHYASFARAELPLTT